MKPFPTHYLRRLTILLFVGLMTISVFASGVLGQDESEIPELTIDTDNAAVWHGEETDDWDNPYTDPGAVIYHDGLFHMFRNGFRAWPAEVQIGYLTSEDGLEWTEVSELPVYTHDEVPFDATAALASSALVEDDGTWVLYVYIWPRLNGPVSGSVARMTADDPAGPWTMDEQLSLTVGSVGEWDAGTITVPSVVKTDTGYNMYYSANGGSGWLIGLATSEDGISWTKYDDPETTEAPFAESDPVFTVADDESAWDGQNVHQPRVRLTEDGFVMLYRSFVGGQRDRSFGLSISDDGVAWERLFTDPIIADNDVSRRGLWFSELEYHDGVYYVFLEIQRGYQSQTDIYVGTLDGPLR